VFSINPSLFAGAAENLIYVFRTITQFKGNKRLSKRVGDCFHRLLLRAAFRVLIGWVRIRGVTWNFADQEQTGSHIFWMVNILRLQLIAGFWEELLFRGYLIQTPNTKTKFFVSAIISSFLFGVLHYLVPPYASLPVALLNSLLGFLFAYCYAKKGLWFTIGLHFAWNTLPSLLFGLLHPETSLVRLTNSVPNWLNASGTVIDPWLLLLMVSFCLGFTREKKNQLYPPFS
jgi:membrane protease YdiL (CAAX protease family)